MTDPCQQAPTIHRMETKVDRLTDVVSQIAVQQNDITHLTTSLNGLRDWMIKIERRVGELEKAPGGAAIRMWVVLYTSGIGAIFALIVWSITSGVLRHG